MGYANPAQLSAGIHTRQYSRAFIVNDGSQSVVFISVDCALMDQVIKTEVRILLNSFA
jgi:neutral ceramidase